MKTLLILILSLALAAAAFLTRPSEADFRSYIKREMRAEKQNTIEKVLAPSKADAFISQTQFKDRYLWVDVQKDGKTLYTGAFSHWFDHQAVVPTK